MIGDNDHNDDVELLKLQIMSSFDYDTKLLINNFGKSMLDRYFCIILRGSEQEYVDVYHNGVDASS